MSEEKIDRLLSAMAIMQAESERRSEEMRAESERRDEEAMRARKTMDAMEERIRLLMDDKSVDQQLSKLEPEKNESTSSNYEESEISEPDAITVSSRPVVRSSHKPTKPPLFAGEPNVARPRLWLGFKIQMDSYFEEMMFCGDVLDDRRKVNLFVQNLAVPAVIMGSNVENRLLAKAPVEKLTYEKFIAKLDKVYVRKDISTLYDDMFSIEQAIGEFTTQYYERFNAMLCELLDGADVQRDVAVNWFSNGLLDVLKEKLTYRRHADSILAPFAVDEPEEAVEKCFEIVLAEENMLRSSGRSYLLSLKRKSVPLTVPGSKGDSRAVLQQTRAPVDRQSASGSMPSNQRPNTTEDKKKGIPAGPRCYECQERGHFARNCKSRKRSLNNMFAPLSNQETDEEVESQQDQSKK